MAESLDRFGRRHHVEISGAERLPRGGAMLVANHAFGVWDVAFALARIHVDTGRVVRSLGEHLWWRIPGVGRAASAMGMVDGTLANAVELLRSGELVLVLPGGAREALKPRELRYRLLWGDRYGFVRASLRSGAPLVPLACVGGDDIVELRGNAFERGRRLRLPFPVPLPARLPRRARLTAAIGEPIPVAGRCPLDAEEGEEDAAVRRLRREVEGALHELIERELARRAGFP